MIGRLKIKTKIIKYLFPLIVVFVCGSFLLSYMESFDICLRQWIEYDTVFAPDAYTINTKGCTIPDFYPLDDSIKNLIEYPSDIPQCPHADHALLGSDRKKIWIKRNTYLHYNISKTEEITCCYRYFYRPGSIDNIESATIDDRSKYLYCIYFKDFIEVNHEFVHVACSVDDRKIYEQYFVFAVKKDFSKHDSSVTEITPNKTSYNVLILGIDAVSRLNFHRTMPNTVNYLAKKGAIEFLGYNKVGDNTFPNLIPMLMGLKAADLKKTCQPYDSSTFDNCPFIWQWYKQAGYYTALGEDSSNIGTFNYLRTGFAISPTDYYLRTFINEASKNVGTQKDFNTYLCMQDKYFYKVLLDYVESLTERLANKRLFGFFWEISMSHDYLNYPMKMDNDYFEFLNKLDTSSYLEETVLVLVSDHGMRWGPIRDTKQGRLEERLPFLYVLLPETFKNNYTFAYQNMKLNSKRLITPFDVHATLTDLLDLENIGNDVIKERSSKQYGYDRSISLFLPVPDNRTCAVADIDDHWCTCHKQLEINKRKPQSQKAAKMLVFLINTMLKAYSQCSLLTLENVMDVTEIYTGEPGSENTLWTEYMVVVKTGPGGAVFEATLRHANAHDSWKLMGTPSRLNLYGNQSYCVDHSQIKLYCYCR